MNGWKTSPARWGLWLASLPWTALAQTPAAPPLSEINALRQAVQALRSQYEERLAQLEGQLQTLLAQSSARPPAEPAPAPIPPAPSTALSTVPSFNPELSLILSGGLFHDRQSPTAPGLWRGIAQAEGSTQGWGQRGLNLGETELGLSANIDPWTRGSLTLAVDPQGPVSVEEAYVQSTALGAGLRWKVGRFYSGVGYLNAQHAHAWDFYDPPMAYQAFLGGQYGDDGLQLQWLAPTEQYLQWGLEWGRGRSFPATEGSRNGPGMMALTAHTGGDWGESHNWRAGVSWWQGQADGQRLQWLDPAGQAMLGSFTGTTRIRMLDGVWKWAPGGNASRQSFKLQAEWLQMDRRGEMSVSGPAQASDGFSANGAYVQALYQFRPGWRTGWRAEALWPGPRAAPVPARHSWVLDHAPSEFARWRLQWTQDASRAGPVAHRWLLQYQMSLGAHPAHAY